MAILNDRFTMGFVAGLIAGVPTLLFNLTAKHFFQVLRFLDFGAIMIFGHKPKNIFEAVFAASGTIMSKAVLGIILRLC